MLGTRERTLLLESLRPPTGYRLRRAVGTSFTLDLIALLTAPLAFTFFDAHDDDGAPVADPMALLEALRRHAANVTLFCQAGAIAVPRPEQTLLAYVEDSVIEVQPRVEGGTFHPKVWVLNFQADNGTAVYRVLCLSRNLTFARTWDTCLRLEGQLTQRQRGYSRNKPFADLLLALPELAIREPATQLQEDLQRMAYEIRRVDFESPRPFSDFRIHNFGLDTKRGRPFPKSRRSLVVSPYLAGSVVQDLISDHGLEVLVSRPEAFKDVTRGDDRHVLPKTCYVLSPGAELNARVGDQEAEQQSDRPPPVEDEVELAGLHAKLFLFENGRETRLFTGSANATGAAFHVNVEVLIELIGNTKDCGIASFLGHEDDPKLETIRSLLQEYTPTDGPEPEEDRTFEKQVDRLARNLATASLTATVHHMDAEQRWDTTLSGELPEIPAGAVVKVWPATLPSEAAQWVDDRGAGRHEPAGHANQVATFRGMSFEALTAFFAFEVSMREGGQEAHKRFVITAGLVGAPEDRKQRLLRSLLQDRRRVLQLLLLILMGEGADVSAFVRAAGRDSTGPHGPLGGLDRTTLLEALLRCLGRSPERIDDVARLIADLESTPSGQELLPEGLGEIWEPVWAAREAHRS